MADYLNKYDTTAQYTAETSERAALGETVSLVTLDGKVYYDRSTTKIGDKVYNVVKMPDGKRWLAQNLDWLPDGITLVTSGTKTYDTPSACYYGYTNNNLGLLYNKHSVTIINSILPSGWRIATESDWTNLFNSIGGNTVENIRKLKSSAISGTGSWVTPGSDVYGFELRCTGYRGSSGTFVAAGTCYFYTSTEVNATYSRGVIMDDANCTFGSFDLPFYPIRLVKG